MKPLAELPLPYRILLGPGPSMVDPRVMRVLSTPVLGHLDPAYLKVMDEVQSLLRQVFETANPLTITISGTGTAAMEAAVANLVEPGDPVLCCISGYFGSRLAEITRLYGGSVTELHQTWGNAIDLSDVKAALQQTPARIVTIVHAETSTGVLQPLDGLAEIVHNQGGYLVVDAVTSLGGLKVGVDEQGMDICYSGSQKCLGCPPGLGPITVSQTAFERITRRKQPVSGFYLDLVRLSKYWGPERQYHHTASSTLNIALLESLRNIIEEGLEARWQRHDHNAHLLWEGLQEIGMELLVPEEIRLPSLTTVRIPSGVDDLSVRRQLLEDYNLEISGGLGELKGKVWRIGLMGYSSRPENILLLVSALKKILAR